MQSVNKLKYKIKSNDFINIISKKMKVPQIDTIRDTLKVIDNQGLYKRHSKIIKKAKPNKVLEKGTIDGYTVAAMMVLNCLRATTKVVVNIVQLQ